MTGSPRADLLKLAIRNGLMNMSAISAMHDRRHLLLEIQSRVRIEGQMLVTWFSYLNLKTKFFPEYFARLLSEPLLVIDIKRHPVWCH